MSKKFRVLTSLLLSLLLPILISVFFYLDFNMQSRIKNWCFSSPKDNFPTTIEGFGYHFNEAGELRDAEGKPFEFAYKPDDHSYNQRRYEALGECVTPHVYGLLESACGLKKLPVPVNPGNSPSTFIFASEDWDKNTDKLMVLIHGSGVVRAGQWARSLVINESLDKGTQIPYIKWAMEQGYAVLVLNTNDNFVGKKKIKGSEDPEQHSLYVWDHYVMKSPARKLAVVAHSAGGQDTVILATERFPEFSKRVFAVALTDSAHSMFKTPEEIKDFVIKVGRNWVSSDRPVGMAIWKAKNKVITRVSAGHEKHVWTSYCAQEDVFAYISALDRDPEAQVPVIPSDDEEEGREPEAAQGAPGDAAQAAKDPQGDAAATSAGDAAQEAKDPEGDASATSAGDAAQEAKDPKGDASATSAGDAAQEAKDPKGDASATSAGDAVPDAKDPAAGDAVAGKTDAAMDTTEAGAQVEGSKAQIDEDSVTKT